jgi:hypothetical protein
MNIDENSMVPIAWLVATCLVLGGALVAAFVAWITREFDKHDRAHDRTYKSIIRIHKRLDSLGADKRYDSPKPEGS